MTEPTYRARMFAGMAVLRDVLLVVWMFGAALFFAFRFGFAFYRDNETAIAGLLDKLSGQ